MVKQIIDDMQKISPTHRINYTPGKTKMIYCDKDKLVQVLNNLISNAIKYSPRANHIVVETQLHKNGIEFSVQDFGIGISQQEQKSVFDQFYRVNRTVQSTFPGMGIGLYICSQIVKNMGGKIWVESIINQGSTFYVRLPFGHSSKA